jgi:hypothetical protein
MKREKKSENEGGLKVKSQIKAGAGGLQHNRPLKVKSQIKAGGVNWQHNRALRAR